jgi:hypothetical protein
MSGCNECSCCQVLPGTERSLTAALAEVERLRAALETQRALLGKRGDDFGDEVLRLDGECGRLLAERDRLRAVLAETRENVDRLARLFYSRLMVSYDVDWESAAKSDCRSQACAVLAALRARAGLEPTP